MRERNACCTHLCCQQTLLADTRVPPPRKLRGVQLARALVRQELLVRLANCAVRHCAELNSCGAPPIKGGSHLICLHSNYWQG
jgi:hypothetical protein